MPTLVLDETPSATTSRRGRRVVRKIDLWSVLKVSVVFYACMLALALVAGVVLWVVARIVGVVGNVEKFVGELLALDRFHFRAWQILRVSVFGGCLLVVLGSLGNVLLTALYNLISEIVGGVEVAVDDEAASRPVV